MTEDGDLDRAGVVIRTMNGYLLVHDQRSDEKFHITDFRIVDMTNEQLTRYHEARFADDPHPEEQRKRCIEYQSTWTSDERVQRHVGVGG